MKHSYHRLTTFGRRLVVLALGFALSLGFSFRITQAHSPDNPGDVRTALAAQGTSRVIIALHKPQGGIELRAQAAEIAQAQAAVLAELTTEDFSLIHRYTVLPGLVGEATADGLETLLNRPEVAAVALDLPVQTALTESAALINADDVWHSLGFTGAGVTVAILDTGVDLAHPDLADSIVAQHCFNRDASCPPDDTTASDNAQDENGHGTHVAGIITGDGQEAPPGIAAGADIVAVRVLGASGTGFTSDVLAGLDWVIANQEQLDVQVINLSLGGGRYSGVCDEADANTMLYAQTVEAARQAGITLFAASGNSGLVDQIMLPACISGMLAVGSTYDADVGSFTLAGCTDPQTGPDQVVCASNSSSALDLLAPGVVINSTVLGGGLGAKSGTSMSTAHASAVAALMLEANPGLTPTEIETALKETGLPITDPRNDRVTPRLDALAAVIQVSGSELMTITGTILLQGRTDHGGTDLLLSEESCSIPVQTSSPASSGLLMTTTDADGRFEFAVPADRTYRCLQALQPGYLGGQRELPAGDVGTTTLLAGDVTGDNFIDIFDLALLGNRFNSNDALTDINADGTVNILDLVLAATNYKKRGPIFIGLDDEM